MKLNEALIIGGALLAGLVFFKGTTNKQFSGKSAIPVLPIENKTKTFEKIIIPDLQTFPIPYLKPAIRKSNNLLKNIFNIETEAKDQRVSYLQNELDQTRGYIEKQTDTANYNKFDYPYNKYDQFKGYLYKSDIVNIENRYGLDDPRNIPDEKIIQYYEDLVREGETTTGNRFGRLQFPIMSAALTNLYNQIIVKKTATESIGPATTYAERQQQGIDQVQKEYQTRFGSLSRYG